MTGKFFGAAQGDLPGAFNAVVDHQQLSTAVGVPVTITGGSFSLYTAHTIVGSFTGGTITLTNPSVGCGNETFQVTGTLHLQTGGSGTFNVVLTHLQTPLGTQCLTYGATVDGSLKLSP